MASFRGAVLAAGAILAAAFPAYAHNGGVTATGTTFSCPTGRTLLNYTISEKSPATTTNPIQQCADELSFSMSSNNLAHGRADFTWTATGGSCNVFTSSTDTFSSYFTRTYVGNCSGLPNSCAVGAEVSQTVTVVQGTAVPSSACLSGCFGTLTKAQALVTFWKPGGTDEEMRVLAYSLTGATCGTNTNVGTSVPDGCAVSAGGRTVCTAEKNCGTVNGKKVCADPSSLCGSVNGQQFCLDSSGGAKCWRGQDGGDSYCASQPTSTDALVASPPSPDTGTAGTPAKPDASVVGNSATTGNTTGSAPPFRVDVFTPAQISQSTMPAGGPGGSSISGGSGAVCGAPPLPACSVDVNETGTPTVGSGDKPTFDQDAARSSVEEVASSNPAADKSAPTLPTSYGSCETLTFNVGHTAVTVPNAAVCTLLERLKAILGWGFYLGVVLYGWHRVMNVNSAEGKA